MMKVLRRREEPAFAKKCSFGALEYGFSWQDAPAVHPSEVRVVNQ